MSTLWLTITIILVITLAWFLWRTATRIDKLHRKVAASRISLDQQLQRRAGASIDIAISQLLDPASAMMIANEAYNVIDDLGPITEPEDALTLTGLSTKRELEESELSECLRQVFPDETSIAEIRADPIGDELVYRIASSWYKAGLARRFHNQAVADARAARRHWWVRIFGLAGYAQLPETCELDDAMPTPLAAAAMIQPASGLAQAA